MCRLEPCFYVRGSARLRLWLGCGKQRMVLVGHEPSSKQSDGAELSTARSRGALSQRALPPLVLYCCVAATDDCTQTQTQTSRRTHMYLEFGIRFLGVDNDFFAPRVQCQRGELETIRERSSSLSPGLRNLYHGVLHPGVLFAALLSEVCMVQTCFFSAHPQKCLSLSALDLLLCPVFFFTAALPTLYVASLYLHTTIDAALLSRLVKFQNGLLGLEVSASQNWWGGTVSVLWSVSPMLY